MNLDRTDTVILWFATTLVVLGTIGLLTPSRAQYEGPYGGPPMWDRRRDPDDEQRRFPPRTPWGPQMEPCIMRGDCRGPRYEDDPDEGWRRPRRDPRWERWA